METMENKVCPMLLMGNPSNVGGRAECKRGLCAWYWCENCALVTIAQGCTDLEAIYDAIFELPSRIQR